MKNIGIFCGSKFGADPAFKKEAFLLGQTIAQKGIGLVYGGAKVGLMGEVADGALDRKGEVIGVIPSFLKTREVAHLNLTRLEEVETMNQRKSRMAELSNAFISLPGGWGTLDEIAEMLTWSQLGLQNKPCILLNTQGFFDPLVAMLDQMVDKQFVSLESHSFVKIAKSPEEAVELCLAGALN